MNETIKSDEMTLAQELANLTLRIATPISWHDRKEGWPKRVYGGTCFFLRFANGVIGVTANHVVDVLQKALSDNPNTVCQIRTSKPVDLPKIIIDRCERLDIATFGVSEDFIATIGATVLDCRLEWPPPEPVVGRAVSFCGFPEAERHTPERGVLTAFACGSVAMIDDVTERDLIVTYDPTRDKPAPWAPWTQPLGYNMSGCSGGPVLSHGIKNGLQRWFPIAMIIRGPRGQGTGETSEWDMVTMRRIDKIQQDGGIDGKDTGWLPA